MIIYITCAFYHIIHNQILILIIIKTDTNTDNLIPIFIQMVLILIIIKTDTNTDNLIPKMVLILIIIKTDTNTDNLANTKDGIDIDHN